MLACVSQENTNAFSANGSGIIKEELSDGNGQFSKDKTKRTATELRNTMSGTLGFFDPWLGVSYERLLLPYWGMDVSIGIIGGSIGTKFYYPKLADGKASCYIGISEGVLLLVGTKHYIPIGFTYLSKNIFRISFDVGPQIFHNAEEETWIGFSLKLGVSF